jgi:hypothetical protein
VRDRGGGYTTFDFPGAGGTAAGLGDINDRGRIAGFYSDDAGTYYSFLRSRRGTFTPIENPSTNGPSPYGSGTAVYGINDRGVMVGGVRCRRDGPRLRARPPWQVQNGGLPDGFDLATRYEEHRLKAYESISMPGLPNHFMIFGPYGWTGASWHVLVQTASTHIVRVLGEAPGAAPARRGVRGGDRPLPPGCARADGGLALVLQPLRRRQQLLLRPPRRRAYVRPSSGREARRDARGFPLSDYRYDTLRPSPEPAEREKVTA